MRRARRPTPTRRRRLQPVHRPPLRSTPPQLTARSTWRGTVSPPHLPLPCRSTLHCLRLSQVALLSRRLSMPPSPSSHAWKARTPLASVSLLPARRRWRSRRKATQRTTFAWRLSPSGSGATQTQYPSPISPTPPTLRWEVVRGRPMMERATRQGRSRRGVAWASGPERSRPRHLRQSQQQQQRRCQLPHPSPSRRLAPARRRPLHPS